jgi:putative tryptophan/tyrosine transport system substrate-binding protein
MRRRAFMTLLGGAAVSWPLAARAQQPAMPVAGVLLPTLPDGNAGRLHAFRQDLKDTGHVEGENVATTGQLAISQPAFCPAGSSSAYRY